jgi:hypothetical protein
MVINIFLNSQQENIFAANNDGFICLIGSRGRETFPDRIESGLRSIGDMQFVQYAADIFCDGPLMDYQRCRNLLVTQAACDQAQGFQLPARE